MEVMKQVMGSLGSTEARKNREYFVPGQYWLKINEVKTGRAGVTEFNPDGDYDYFAVEFEIVHSTCAERPAGTFVNYMISMKHSKMERMYARDIKNFLMAAYTSRLDGKAPNNADIDANVFEKTVGEDQPLAGVKLKGVAKTVPTKSGGEFTTLTWVQWDGQMPDFSTGTLPLDNQSDLIEATPF